MSEPRLTVVAALCIQAEQLAGWKRKLNGEVYTDLAQWVDAQNTKLTDKSSGYEVCRGTDDCPLCDPAKPAKSFSVMTREELLGYFGHHGTCTLVSKQMDRGHHVRIVRVDGQVASFDQSCELACFRAAATWLKYNAKPIA